MGNTHWNAAWHHFWQRVIGPKLCWIMLSLPTMVGQTHSFYSLWLLLYVQITERYEGIFDPIAVTCCYYTLARAPLAKCSEGFWCVFLVAEGHSSTALSPSKRLRNKIGLLAKRGAKRIETHYITIEPPKKIDQKTEPKPLTALLRDSIWIQSWIQSFRRKQPGGVLELHAEPFFGVDQPCKGS